MNEQGIIDHISETHLFAYLDDALSWTEKARADGHLAHCATCQAQLLEIQELFSVIEMLPDAALGVDLAPGVIASITAQERSWLSGRWLALVQLAIAVGLFIYSGPRLLAGNWTDRISVYSTLFDRWLVGFLESALVTWASWSSWAETLLIQARELVQRPAPGLVPGFEILPWAVALGVSWLLVNGFFLRPGDGNDPTRQTHRSVEHRN